MPGDLFEGYRVDEYNRLLSTTILDWIKSDCPWSMSGQSNGAVRFFVRIGPNGPAVYKERWEPRKYGPGGMWGIPKNLGHPVNVLVDVMTNVLVAQTED